MSLKEITTPELIDLFEQAKRDVLVNINCVQIGKIEAFDADNQTATIQIQSKQIESINEQGVKTLRAYPLLLECPVLVLSGGDSRITFPIKQGDGCIVLFNDREIDNWYTNGGEEAPQTLRVHDLSDGLALVGLNNLQTRIQDYSTTSTDWRYNAISKITQNAITTIISNTNVNINGIITLDGDTSVIGSLSAGNGASGTFTSQENKVITVTNGIITSIV